mmetsp:Transcript_19975/g.33272  ORF Transcript_19975/g.33272 Transcript_19975/m.33272 type:complete len:81 (+) Transcript_19975:806-1048(+)
MQQWLKIAMKMRNPYSVHAFVLGERYETSDSSLSSASTMASSRKTPFDLLFDGISSRRTDCQQEDWPTGLPYLILQSHMC